MSENKCCGNCKHFKNEDVEGWGWCSFNKTKTHCAQSWDCHNNTFNGWTEITPDNVEDLFPVINRVMVAYKLGEGLAGYSSLTELYKPLKDLALTGGYYFFILPELKIG